MRQDSAGGIGRGHAWFEYHHGSVGGARSGVGVEAVVDSGPQPPQSIVFVAIGSAGADRSRGLVLQADHGVRLGLEVEPPGRVSLVSAVHRQHDGVRAVLDGGNFGGLVV
jgi:hypothetical protein